MAGGRAKHAMVFQRPVMLRRSARANIRHALDATGAGDAAARTEESLERFGLLALAGEPARLLSGGEQQRLAIARAWALRPEMLFLDEPTSQLDPGATRQIEALIAALAAEGMTILMTTHDIGQLPATGGAGPVHASRPHRRGCGCRGVPFGATHGRGTRLPCRRSSLVNVEGRPASRHFSTKAFSMT